MSKKKKPVQPNKKAGKPFLKRLQNTWGQTSPVLQFILAFGAVFGLFYVFYLSDFFTDTVVRQLTNVQASIGSLLLNVLGQETSVSDAMISGNGFSVNIKKGCDGLEPLAMLLSGILVFPIVFRLKWQGLLFGSLVLMALNQVRIVALYFAGKSMSAELFDWLHLQGGFVVFTAFVIVIWLTWANWAMRTEQQFLNIKAGHS